MMSIGMVFLYFIFVSVFVIAMLLDIEEKIDDPVHFIVSV
jgi:hypothetical protein